MAQEGDGFWERLSNGDGWVQLRFFSENVDQSGFSKDAHGTTLRTVVGYKTPDFDNWSAMVEFLDVHVVGNTLYNDTIGGPTDRPVVADPEGTDFNRVWGQWSREDIGTFRAGRQRIKLDNDRFIGNVGWRQREQLYDSLTAQGTTEGFEWFYGYLSRVNRVFGPESPVGEESMDSHILNVGYGFDPGRLVLYAYYLDFEKTVVRSTMSVGARFVGSQALNEEVDLLYTAEYAQQTDVADNPANTNAYYAHAEVGPDFGPVGVQAGFEILSGERVPGEAFQTPLATLHAFNGWADKFLNTPSTGLHDYYVRVSGMLAGNKLQAVLHSFTSDATSTDYGVELDLSAVRKINDNVTVGLKFADYDTDGNAAFPGDADTRRAWFWLNVSI